MKHWRKWFMFVIFLVFSFSNIGQAKADSIPFSDVPKTFWAYSEIQWAYEQKAIKGYPNGTFRPNDYLTEAQFVSMIFNYMKFSTREANKGEHWAQPMYEVFHTFKVPLNGYNSDAMKNKPLTRGGVAQIFSTLLKGESDLHKAVQLMYDYGLSTGRTGKKTFEDYGANDYLTRAQATVFLKRLDAKWKGTK
ncbi:S-layer homology domain-containing protein [Thermolongibacillus altinsuensis]